MATDVLGLPNAVLAPWSAALVVHATVYRTFTRGAQQVSATVLAVVMAWAVGQVLGTNPADVRGRADPGVRGGSGRVVA